VITEIASTDDPRLGGYRAVSEPDLARRQGLFVAEGRRVVERVLSQTALVSRSVLVTHAARLALAASLDARPEVPVLVVSQAVMNEVSGFDIHRGCLALVERPPRTSWQTVAENASRLVVLEHVGDADNVGSIFRCAAALGADGVLLGPACADPLYRKAIRTSMAATLSVPFADAEPWPDVLRALRRDGWDVVGLTPHDGGTLWESAPTGTSQAVRTALVAGHEGDGLSAAALAACSTRARIPMASGVDSLNVGVSVGVSLYELARRAACQGAA
jgi:tRNA G18 (ribose-2'-O)-methylase SpoU